jgi:predicted nucleic acid binding AN1-type Zn finger protein
VKCELCRRRADSCFGKCNQCGRCHCRQHRLPFDHACPGRQKALDATRARLLKNNPTVTKDKMPARA